MTARAMYVLLAFFTVSSVKLAEPLVQEGLSKFLGSLTSVKQVRIPDLLNQLCNESQNFDVILRDACYGCFYRASTQPTGYPMLMAMSSCADVYLNNTDFSHCQSYLRNATAVPNTRVNPTVIYCTFLECIRQVNKDTLLRECVGEAVRASPNFNYTDVSLAQLFVNTTACVLAKTRCAYTNPITGKIQEDELANKLQVASMNAILVNTNYDINIVQLPHRYDSVIDVCSKYRNIEQASWPGVTC